AREVIAPLLQRDRVDARARELSQRDRAARAGADDDGGHVERAISRSEHPRARNADGERLGHAPPRTRYFFGVQPSSGRLTSGPSYPITPHVRGSRQYAIINSAFSEWKQPRTRSLDDDSIFASNESCRSAASAVKRCSSPHASGHACST